MILNFNTLFFSDITWNFFSLKSKQQQNSKKNKRFRIVSMHKCDQRALYTIPIDVPQLTKWRRKKSWIIVQCSLDLHVCLFVFCLVFLLLCFIRILYERTTRCTKWCALKSATHRELLWFNAKNIHIYKLPATNCTMSTMLIAYFFFLWVRAEFPLLLLI